MILIARTFLHAVLGVEPPRLLLPNGKRQRELEVQLLCPGPLSQCHNVTVSHIHTHPVSEPAFFVSVLPREPIVVAAPAAAPATAPAPAAAS